MDKDKEKPKIVIFKQTSFGTLIQTIATLGTVILLFLVYCQIKQTTHEQSISLRPYLQLQIEDEFPGPVQVWSLRNKGQDNEIWEVGNWITNVGKYPANNIYYYTEINTKSDFININSYENNKPIMISPNMTRLICTDDIARSEVVKAQNQGENIYRHFYVEYQDKDGNKYETKSIWMLYDYEVGSPIYWHLVTIEGN